MLRAADRYAYTSCGSTAYCYLFYLGDEQILVDIRKSCRSSACLVRIAGPCPAEPVQLVPAQLGLSPAGSYQLWCTSLRIATETRPARKKNVYLTGCVSYRRVSHRRTPYRGLHFTWYTS